MLPETPIRLLKRLLWWPTATARWLWEGNRFWLLPLAAIGILVFVAWVLPCPVERAVRLVGLLFQLLGIVTIALKLQAARRQFPVKAFSRWWHRRPRFGAQKTTISAAGTSVSMAAGYARGRVAPGPQATSAQRIAILEESFDKLFDEVGGLGNEVKRRTDELSRNLRSEVAAREQAPASLQSYYGRLKGRPAFQRAKAAQNAAATEKGVPPPLPPEESRSA